MARSPSFAGVLLAAGPSSRMGRDKGLLPWRGATFLSGQIELLKPLTELVIVVAGKNADALAPLVYAHGSFLVINPKPERGQFSSLQIGIREVLNHGRDAAIIALVDRPPAAPATAQRLRSKFSEACAAGKWAVVPEYSGKHGHPVLVGRELIEEFLKAPSDSVAREIEHAHQQKIEYLPVDDPLVVMNVDTPEDYERLTGKMIPS